MPRAFPKVRKNTRKRHKKIHKLSAGQNCRADGVLGRGADGEAALQLAVVHACENMLKLQRKGFIAKGPNWPASHPARFLTAELFGIHGVTVSRYMKERNRILKRKTEIDDHQEERDIDKCFGGPDGESLSGLSSSGEEEEWAKTAKRHMPGPKKKGRKKQSKEEHQRLYKNLYTVVKKRIQKAKETTETMTVDKLLQHVKKEQSKRLGAVGAAMVEKDKAKSRGRGAVRGRGLAKKLWTVAQKKKQVLEFPRPEFDYKDTFNTLRYHLVKMGFEYGKINFNLKSTRGQPYILGWLNKYCEYREESLFEGITGQRLGVVDVFGDETGIWRLECGRYSWYPEGDNEWNRVVRRKGDKWGIAQFILTWWEEVSHFDELTDYEQAIYQEYHAKTSKEDNATKNEKFYTRRAHTYKELLAIWNVRDNGNMTYAKFEVVFETVCDFIKNHFQPDPKKKTKWKAVFHLDNASVHKKKIGKKDFNPANRKATPAELVTWIVDNNPAYYSLLDLVDPDTGDFIEINDLRALALETYSIFKLEQLAHTYGYVVKWSAPYWSEGMPVEPYWANLKVDYRGWEPKFKIKDVSNSIHKFAAKIQGSERDEILKFVQHTDKFCRAVLQKDPGVLTPLVLQTITGGSNGGA